LTYGSSAQHDYDMNAANDVRIVSEIAADDVIIVSEIVKQLMRGDSLRPRPFSFVPFDATPAHLEEVAAAEVSRAIARLRSPVPPEPSAADARRAARALAPFNRVPWLREVAWFLTVASQRQEPPPHSDFDKWRCASEAFYLVDTLSRTLPSGDRDGAFIIITEHLFEALRGKRPGVRTSTVPVALSSVYGASLG
jgi:hypothetical protein